MLPNFLIIGAARSGTTTLYSHLQEHPDVYLPANKRPEPHFFYKNSEYEKGLAYYEERNFSAWSGQRAVGEASTSYVFGPEVPKRIKSRLPSIKLICILRNPVERALSNYWHTIKSGIETLSFEEALLHEGHRKAELADTPLGEIAPFAYVERGLYHHQLVRWLQEFDRAQMKIIIFDDFVAAPHATLVEVAQFLDISPDPLPRRKVEAENKSVPDGTRLTSECRQVLIKMFQNDVVELSNLLGRDLTAWLSVTE